MGREKEIEKIIEHMLKEGRKQKAPVFEVERTLRKLSPFWKLTFVMLSSRTKDETTLKALKNLLKTFKTEEKVAKAKEEEIEKAIYGVAFWREKAKALKEIAKTFLKNPPSDFDSLIKLPMVGRKTANVYLSLLGEDRIGVDTHVHRISNRLGWVKTKKPEETEKELKKIIPKRLWRKLNLAMVSYGQTVCLPKRPRCEECGISNFCEFRKRLFLLSR